MAIWIFRPTAAIGFAADVSAPDKKEHLKQVIASQNPTDEQEAFRVDRSLDASGPARAIGDDFFWMLVWRGVSFRVRVPASEIDDDRNWSGTLFALPATYFDIAVDGVNTVEEAMRQFEKAFYRNADGDTRRFHGSGECRCTVRVSQEEIRDPAKWQQGMTFGASDVIRTRHIEAQSISLRSPDGKHKMHFEANSEIAGMWLEPKEGGLVAIYTQYEAKQVCIGIYDADRAPGIQFGLALTAEGKPFIQWIDEKEKVHFIDPADLVLATKKADS